MTAAELNVNHNTASTSPILPFIIPLLWVNLHGMLLICPYCQCFDVPQFV
jgi:hypothetical protein